MKSNQHNHDNMVIRSSRVCPTVIRKPIQNYSTDLSILDAEF